MNGQKLTLEQRSPYPGLIGRQLGQRLVEVVGRGARVIELRADNGTLAGPLRAAGASVVGVDLVAPPPWQRGRLDERPPAVRGLVAGLPFATHSFDAALAVDVLDVIEDDMALAREAQRVLHPGTPLILGMNWQDPSTIDARVRTRWLEILGQLAPGLAMTRATALPDLLARIAAAGGQVGFEGSLLQWSDQVSAATEIDRIATGRRIESRLLADSLLQESVERLNVWMFAARVDPNVTDIALREFRVAIIRWPSG